MIFGRKIPCGNTNFHRGFCFMNTSDSNFFGTEKVSRILLKIAPPVMLAQLIQALYNIVDSLFVGKYFGEWTDGTFHYLSIAASYDCHCCRNGSRDQYGNGTLSGCT